MAVAAPFVSRTASFPTTPGSPQCSDLAYLGHYAWGATGNENMQRGMRRYNRRCSFSRSASVHFAELRQYTLSPAMSTAIRLIQMSNFKTWPGVGPNPVVPLRRSKRVFENRQVRASRLVMVVIMARWTWLRGGRVWFRSRARSGGAC